MGYKILKIHLFALNYTIVKLNINKYLAGYVTFIVQFEYLSSAMEVMQMLDPVFFQ